MARSFLFDSEFVDDFANGSPHSAASGQPFSLGEPGYANSALIGGYGALTHPVAATMAVPLPPTTPGDPSLTGFNTSDTYNENTVNAVPQLFVGNPTFAYDNSNNDLQYGELRLTGVLAEDRISVHNQGTGAGQIGFSGSNITYGGAVIGTLTGGNGTDVAIDFTSNTTDASVQALFQQLTYADVSDTPTPDRELTFGMYYLNNSQTNTLNHAAPTFAEATGASNPFNGVTLGNAVTFFDADGDGDRDIIAARSDGSIAYFRNDAGAYTQLTGASNPFNGVNTGESDGVPAIFHYSGFPNFNLEVGTSTGTIKEYVNQGAGYMLATLSEFNGVNVGGNGTPAFVDIDGDGDLDLFVGAADGTIQYYYDDGASSPNFVHETGFSNPFNNVDVGSNASVAFGDFDNDGDFDAVVASSDGTIHYFENTFASYFPQFAERTGAANPFNGITVGSAAHVAVADVNGDGNPDLVVTDAGGNARVFLDNVPSTSIHIHVTPQSEGPSLTGLGPDPVFSEGVTTANLNSTVSFTAQNNNFNGGELIVSGLDPLDRLSIENQGTGAGQVGTSGSSVTYGGVTIGTWSGGVGHNLVVHFNASATTTSIQALFDHLQFTSVGDSPTEFRTLSFYVTDAAGEVANGPFEPSFNYVSAFDTQNPFYGINTVSSIGPRAAPGFTDYDNDGNLDLIVGQQDGTLATFHNNGDGTFNELTAGTGPFGGISVSGNAKISFGDLDHDGDMDLVVGGTDGTLHYFKDNAGTYVEQTGGSNPFNGIDAGADSAPTFVDIDGDGDLDLVVGGASADGGVGTVYMFQNNGGVFTQLTGASNPFNNNIVAGTHVNASFGDVDGDGDLDMVVAGDNEDVQYYENTGTRTAPVFTHETGSNNPFNGAYTGGDSTVTLVDYDHDGDLDLVAGGSNGGVSSLYYFQNNMPLPNLLVQVTPVNDAPVVATSSVSVGNMFEDGSPNAAPVSTIVTSAFSDPDGNSSSTGMLGGIAITGNAESGQGTWQYFDGSGWQNVGTSISDSSALVLLPSTLLRFVPSANFNGTEPSLTAHLVDSSFSGNVGDLVDVSGGNTGGATPYSTGTFTIAGSVVAVNDAPVVAQSSVSLLAVDENTVSPAGQTIASFASAAFSDPADAAFGATPNNFLGVVIIQNTETTQGHWQYSDDGTTWTNVGHPSAVDGSGLGLHADTELRFVPASGYSGAAPTLKAYLIDDSSGDFFGTGESDFDIEVPSDHGGSTPFSAASFTIGEPINFVDQPPVVTPDSDAAVEGAAAAGGNVLTNDSDPDG
ncbi:MAG TPA: VCBS repeat-containing protein, partial [Rhizomicrobium sp.]